MMMMMMMMIQREKMDKLTALPEDEPVEVLVE